MVISHLVAGVAVVMLAIHENGQEAEPKGPVWVAAVAVAMLLIVDAMVAVVALVGAAIMLAFKKSFGRCFVLIFSVALTLFSALLLIGALVPEEWTEDKSALPKAPVEVE